MKLDFSKFKKIASDEKSTTLKHPKGHSIVIAHKALSPEMQEELDAIPQHLATGGQVEQSSPDVQEPQNQQAPVVVNIQQPSPQPQMAAMAPPPPAMSDPNAVQAGQQQLLPGGRGRAITGQVPQAPQEIVPGGRGVAMQGQGIPSVPPEADMPMDPSLQQGSEMGVGSMAQPQVPPPESNIGAQEQSGLMGALGRGKAAIKQEADAIGAQGQAEAKISNDAAQAEMDHAAQAETKFNELTQEYHNIQEDIKNSHIDPKHYLNSMGVGQKIKTVFGLILGGFAGGLTGRDNPAQKALDNLIENDIQAQKAEIGKKENLLTANLRQFGNVKDAMEMTRVIQQGVVASKLRAAAAEAQDPIAKARALKEAANMDLQVQPKLAEIAQRQAATEAMRGGAANAAQEILFKIPEPAARAQALKELAQRDELYKNRDAALAAFQTVNKANTLGFRASNPKDALTGGAQAQQLNAALLELSKDITGKANPEVFKQLKAQYYPDLTDDKEEVLLKKKNLAKAFLAKDNFPTLLAYSISNKMPTRFDETGSKKIKLGEPVR